MSRLEEAITRLAIAVEQLTLATLDRPVPTGRVLEAPTLVPAPVQPEPPHPAAAWEDKRPVVPAGTCPVHSEPWKHVPAGVSKKTGKPYAEFWVCPVVGCPSRPAAQ